MAIDYRPNIKQIYSAYLRSACSRSDPVQPLQDAKSLALPPRSIGLALLEIYFSRIYNSELMFFKLRLFQEYLENKVPSYLLRAIFALASLYVSSAK